MGVEKDKRQKQLEKWQKKLPDEWRDSSRYVKPFIDERVRASLKLYYLSRLVLKIQLGIWDRLAAFQYARGYRFSIAFDVRQKSLVRAELF